MSQWGMSRWSMRAWGMREWGKWLLWINAILLFAFLYLPIGVLALFSLNDSKLAAEWHGFTIKWYISLLQNHGILSATYHSLLVALLSTLAATVLGTMVALALETYRFRGQKVVDAIFYLPILTPEIVTGVSLLAFFALLFRGVNGIFALQGDAAWRNGLLTVLLAHIAFNTAFVAVVVRSSLAGFDRSLEEAAQDLGANEWMTFRRVTLPLIAPGILGGALLAFTLSLDNFVITTFVSGPGATTLPIDVFGRIRRSISPEINAISTVMLAFSILLVVVSQRLQQRDRE